jgi:hypothetical protein
VLRGPTPSGGRLNTSTLKHRHDLSNPFHMKQISQFLQEHVTGGTDPHPRHDAFNSCASRYLLTTHIDVDDTSTIHHDSFAYSSTGRPTTVADHSRVLQGSIIVHTSLTRSSVCATELSGCTVRDSTVCCGALLLGVVVDDSRICGGRYEPCEINGSTLIKCPVVKGCRITQCKALKRAFRPGRES